MRLRDYLRGQAVEMRSPLRPEEIERRINSSTLSRWRSFRGGVVGWAGSGRVRLRFRPRLYEYNMSPVLAGRIEPAAGGSRLRLRYGAPGGAYPFFALWLGFIVFFLALILSGDAWSEPGSSEAARRLVPPMVIAIFLAAPFGLHYLGTRNAEAHLDAIIGFVEEIADASLVRREGRRSR